MSNDQLHAESAAVAAACDRLQQDIFDMIDASSYADNVGVAFGETDELHSIFDDAGLSGATGVDNAINNPCMLAAGYAMLDYNGEDGD